MVSGVASTVSIRSALMTISDPLSRVTMIMLASSRGLARSDGVRRSRCARDLEAPHHAEPQNVSGEVIPGVVGCGRLGGRPHPISPALISELCRYDVAAGFAPAGPHGFEDGHDVGDACRLAVQACLNQFAVGEAVDLVEVFGDLADTEVE